MAVLNTFSGECLYFGGNRVIETLTQTLTMFFLCNWDSALTRFSRPTTWVRIVSGACENVTSDLGLGCGWRLGYSSFPHQFQIAEYGRKSDYSRKYYFYLASKAVSDAVNDMQHPQIRSQGY